MKVRITTGACTPMQHNSDFTKKVEANYLMLPPTTPINVAKLIVLSFRLRLLWFQQSLRWKKLIFIVNILVDISKTLGFIIFPIWLDITRISFA